MQGLSAIEAWTGVMLGGGGDICQADMLGIIAMQEQSLPPSNRPPEALGKFISEQNIALYRKCLTETDDEKRRQVLLKLLADELAKNSAVQVAKDRGQQEHHARNSA